MSVKYDKSAGTITIHTLRTTYQMKIGPYGFLLHTYYGSRTEGDFSYTVQYGDRGFSGNPNDAGMDRTVSADVLPLEYSCEGNGDYRPAALSVRLPNGASGCDLRYAGHHVEQGKYSLPNLPTVYGQPEEAETLVVLLKDVVGNVSVELKYGIFYDMDVITRAVVIRNVSEEDLVLQRADSLSLDLAYGKWDMIHFHGRHVMERTPERMPVGHEEITVGSRRGSSSHQHNPFVILAGRQTDEDHGPCLGAAFLYSGSFECCAGAEQFESTRFLMGIQSERLDYRLAPGEEFYGPEVALAFSGRGLTELSHLFHDLISRNVIRGPWKNVRRPVLINTWEAMTMDFDREKLIRMAKASRELGIEMLVLDDGWFGARNDDNAGLGDWYANEAKLGGSIGSLADAIRGLGLQFGLWIEPEMVNEDSDLYRAHPDWAMTIPGKLPVRARNQLVLDFSRTEIVDAVFDQLAKVLDECRPDYLKMDMNRSLSDVYSAVAGYQSQGKILYRYTLGVYHFLDRMTERYPEMLIEGCSGGGGRFDAGMLYYTPQIWCSDNTDAIDRLRIQYGTSFGYPPSTWGAHVSAVPNGCTGRSVPFGTRAVTAMAGTFGYELDPAHLTDEEKAEIPRQIEAFKKYWPLLHQGRYYRLTDVAKDTKKAAWMVVSPDRSEALVSVVAMDSGHRMSGEFVPCRGLDPDALYEDVRSGGRFTGTMLMEVGLPIGSCFGNKWMRQYDAGQVLLRRAEDR